MSSACGVTTLSVRVLALLFTLRATDSVARTRWIHFLSIKKVRNWVEISPGQRQGVRDGRSVGGRHFGTLRDWSNIYGMATVCKVLHDPSPCGMERVVPSA